MLQVHVFHAEDEKRAVILARYSRHTYKMFLWHTDTDEVKSGQWLLHKKIWPAFCRISEQGDLFQFYMAELNPWKAFIVLSIPPYFTATKIIESNDTSLNWTDSSSVGPDDLITISKMCGKSVEYNEKDETLYVDKKPLIRFKDYSFENIPAKSTRGL